jgi:hypothetical protein
MRDPKRLELFYSYLKELHEKVPDLRFGQLMMDFFNWYYSKYKQDFFYAEDEKFIKELFNFVKEMTGQKEEDNDAE